jgi:hypothetical protein
MAEEPAYLSRSAKAGKVEDQTPGCEMRGRGQWKHILGSRVSDSFTNIFDSARINSALAVPWNGFGA